jgi:hypothetical protein
MPPAVLGCASLLNPTDGGVPVVWYGLPGGTSLFVLLQPAWISNRSASERDSFRTAVVCLRRSIDLTSLSGSLLFISPHRASMGKVREVRHPWIAGSHLRGDLK